MNRRTRRPYSALAAVLVLAALLAVFRLAADLAGVILLAAAGAGGYALGRRTAPKRVRVVTNGPGLAAEARKLRRQVDALQAKLEAEMDRADRAEASARAAWDAASSVSPRTRQEHGAARDRLVCTPLSGVHELGGSQ